MYGRCSHWPDIIFSKLVTQDFNCGYLCLVEVELCHKFSMVWDIWYLFGCFAWLQEVHSQRVSLRRAQI
jgi:hypothetical protein